MNWDFMIRYWPLYQEALIKTASLAFFGILGASIWGLLMALVRFYRLPILSQLAQIYIEISRNTPLLIQLFFFYFGLPKLGLTLSSEHCAIFGLIFLGGSYMAETFRSGLEAVGKNQLDSALALGFKDYQIFFHIILPQALSISLPSFSANVIFLLKETSVFSVIALADLMYVAKDLIGLYYETDEALLLLVFAYLLILLPISLLFHWLERRSRYAGFGSSSILARK
ncbi:amino acid ABC transporter permease [Streptococcus sciuri]|uniref:Amino acid ABC transporter permease n=1 Tax=Streptococcus sciuri TaxID=2973939 RepID=A0ABT2F7T6_9STRE|nr:amino acid ABC transporter permease [Streptococcus sciuri]MCS4488526.1 amino acid ABC transporter permease [Streptococcus sciuri]